MHYSSAIVEHIPNKLMSDAKRTSHNQQLINEDVMLQQHKKYVNTLTSIGLKVVQLAADDDLADCRCVLAKDAAIVCGKKAILTRLEDNNRPRFDIDVFFH